MFTSVSIFARVFASSDDSSKFPWLSVYVVLYKSVYCDEFQVHVVKFFFRVHHGVLRNSFVLLSAEIVL